MSRLLPADPLAKRLVAQSLIYSVGAGIFLTGSTVFFTVYAGLSPSVIALGLSVAAGCSTLASVPAGRLADRLGHQRSWCLSALLEGLVFASYPLIDHALLFVCAVALLGANDAFGSSARTAYTLGSFDKKTRIEALAYTRSALNLGFSVGAGACALFLLADSRDVLVGLPVAASLLLLGNAGFIARLPSDRPTDAATAEQPEAHAAVARPKRASVLRNIRFMQLSVVNGLCGLHDVILTVVLPLWVLERTDAPHAVVAGLLLANTGLVILFQVPASRGAESLEGATRLFTRSAGVLATAAVVFVGSFYTSGWTTVAVIGLGVVMLTWSELSQAAGAWGIFAELAPAEGRAAYQGAWRLGTKLTQAAAPLGLTLVVLHGAPVGWFAIATVLLLTSFAAPRAVRAAERELQGVQRRQGAAEPQSPAHHVGGNQ